RLAYELAADLEPDWSRVEVWWGDERCVSPEDERSNYRLTKEALLNRLEQQPLPTHPMRGEPSPETRAEEMHGELHGVGVFDCVLVGLGPDGHVASLFPNL